MFWLMMLRWPLWILFWQLNRSFVAHLVVVGAMSPATKSPQKTQTHFLILQENTVSKGRIQNTLSRTPRKQRNNPKKRLICLQQNTSFWTLQTHTHKPWPVVIGTKRLVCTFEPSKPCYPQNTYFEPLQMDQVILQRTNKILAKTPENHHFT